MISVHVRKGYDLKIAGKPSREVEVLEKPDSVAVLPEKIPFIKPRLKIEVGDNVKVGSILFEDKRNPDLKKALNEDIRKTSLGDKEIDLTLMIDLLEHIPNPAKALEEAKRISEFVLFKVPLEDNLVSRTWNFVKRGEPRQHAIETVGHINVYNFNKLKYQIEKHTGQVLDSYFTNVFEYLRNSEHYKNKMSGKGKLINFVAMYMFRVSPRLCSFIFADFAMILVKCY